MLGVETSTGKVLMYGKLNMTKDVLIGVTIVWILLAVFIFLPCWFVINAVQNDMDNCREKGGVPIHTGNSLYINCASKNNFIDNE